MQTFSVTRRTENIATVQIYDRFPVHMIVRNEDHYNASFAFSCLQFVYEMTFFWLKPCWCHVLKATFPFTNVSSCFHAGNAHSHGVQPHKIEQEKSVVSKSLLTAQKFFSVSCIGMIRLP